MQSRTNGYIFLVLFALSIPTANWMIGNFGTFCVPDGPCLIPVAPGITAPSGVLMVGVALVLRDFVQRSLGFKLSRTIILKDNLKNCQKHNTHIHAYSHISYIYQYI